MLAMRLLAEECLMCISPVKLESGQRLHALTSTESLTEHAILNALNGEAQLNGIDPVAIRNYEPEIRAVIQQLIVASRNK
jgi:hypothetical protein